MICINRPVFVEALQWTGKNYEEAKEFVGKSFLCWNFDSGSLSLVDDEQAHSGDWLIKGENGDLGICRKKLFSKVYMPVGDTEGWVKRWQDGMKGDSVDG